MHRFVVLLHECPPGYVKPSHWDFMLEFDGTLRSWELRTLPAAWSEGGNLGQAEVLAATRLADHRIDFLDYEGPLTANRGSVTQVMAGEFHVLVDEPDQLRVRLESPTFTGNVQLTATSQLGHWQFRLED